MAGGWNRRAALRCQNLRLSARNCEYSAFLCVDIDGQKRVSVDEASSPPEVNAAFKTLAQPSRGRSTPSSFVTAISALYAPPFSSRGAPTTTRPRRRSRRHYLYLPCTYTLMSQLLNGGAAPRPARVQLGAGLAFAAACSRSSSRRRATGGNRRRRARDAAATGKPRGERDAAVHAEAAVLLGRRARRWAARRLRRRRRLRCALRLQCWAKREASAMPSSRRPRRCSRTTGGPSCRSSRATDWRAARCSAGSWRPRRRPASRASSGASGVSTARCGLSETDSYVFQRLGRDTPS